MNLLDTPTLITTGTFLFAVILVVIAYLIIRADQKITSLGLKGSILTYCLGKPQWDFSKSWATSLTAIGALLGTVLAAGGGALIIDKTYIGLNVFFGLLVLIAPILYSATAKYTETGIEGDKGSEPQGYVGIFLLTSLLTVWSVCGELVSVMIILYSLQTTSVITSPIKYLFLIFLIPALLCVGAYTIRTIPWTVQDQLQTADQETNRLMKLVPEPKNLGEKKPIPSMKPWSLL